MLLIKQNGDRVIIQEILLLLLIYIKGSRQEILDNEGLTFKKLQDEINRFRKGKKSNEGKSGIRF
jgi:hypothetical protein